MSAASEGPRGAGKPAAAGPVATPLNQLTDGQRDCLRLVYNHMTSKDIARSLGVSPHTVDMRLRTAMKVLGVATRIDAARLLMQDEHGPDVLPALPLADGSSDDDQAYQSLIYGSSDMASGAESAIFSASASAVGAAEFRQDLAGTDAHQLLKTTFDPSAGGPPRNADALMTSEAVILGSRSGAGTSDPGSGARPLASPPLPWGARNTLSVPMRLAWIAGISIGSALGFGALLSALQSLKGLL
jgi:DNA-binding CsgD family transcriptional regulator